MLSLIPLLGPVFCIVAIALFYAAILNRRINETFFLSNITIIAILYGFGLLNFKGSLLWGYGFVFIVAVLLIALMFYKYGKDTDILVRVAFKTGVSLFFLFLIYSIVINYGRLFYHWDEFSYWGLIVKHMYYFDAFATYTEPGMASIIGRTYYPGISIFQYFWTRSFPLFVEYPSYIASNMLFFSIILVFLNNWKPRSVIITIAVLLTPLYLSSPKLPFLSNVYVDGILSIYFAAAILFYFYFRFEKTLFGILTVAAAMSLLVWAKEVGLILYGLVTMIILFDILVFRRSEIFDFIKLSKFPIVCISKLLLLTSPLTLPILIQASWRIHLEFTTRARGLETHLLGIGLHISQISDLSNMQVLLVENNSNYIEAFLINNVGLLPYQVEVVCSFFKALAGMSLNVVGLSYLQMAFLFVFVMVIFALLLNKSGIDFKRPSANYLFIYFCGIVFTFIVLIYYVFIQPDYQAVWLNSLERYMYPWSMGLSLALLVFIIELKDNDLVGLIRVHKSLKTVMVGFFVILLVVVSYNMVNKINTYNAREGNTSYQDYLGLLVERLILTPFRGTPTSTSSDLRKHYNQILEWSDDLYDEEKHCFFISQGSNGFDVLVTNYVLYPNQVFMSWYTITSDKSYHQVAEPYYLVISSEDWEKLILEEYDYVYIFHYDQRFEDTYGLYFETLQERMLYRVGKDNNGKLWLMPLK